LCGEKVALLSKYYAMKAYMGHEIKFYPFGPGTRFSCVQIHTSVTVTFGEEAPNCDLGKK
jgi:hypothetical protein